MYYVRYYSVHYRYKVKRKQLKIRDTSIVLTRFSNLNSGTDRTFACYATLRSLHAFLSFRPPVRFFSFISNGGADPQSQPFSALTPFLRERIFHLVSWVGDVNIHEFFNAQKTGCCVFYIFGSENVFFEPKWSRLRSCLALIIFRPHKIGEKNHNLCCVFFSKFCQFPRMSTISITT